MIDELRTDNLEPLTIQEGEMLMSIKASHPTYFQAMMSAFGIILDRKKKYSPDENPYFNFETLAKLEGRNIHEVFRTYRNIKEVRMLASMGNFTDESFLDCLRDLINYSALEFGYWLWMEQQNEKSDH